MKRLAAVRSAPRAISVDSGPAFISKAFDRCPSERWVALDFSRHGKPDSAFAKRFTGRLQDEWLNTHWFLSPADAGAMVGAWRPHHNECCPKACTRWMTPAD